MKIIKIEISDFGPLRDKSFDLCETVNVIRGDNESGKSTLLLFIKFALYGIARKTRATVVSEAERAINRDTDKAAGSMTVEHGKKLYRIDRKLIRSGRTVNDKLSVTDLECGMPLQLTVSPGEYFLGIPAEVFESSCFCSQLGTSSIKGVETGAALQNLLSSADESIDTKRTLRSLEAARIYYLHKDGKGGSIFELEEKKEELARRYRTAQDDNCKTSQLQADLAKLEEKISEVSEKQRVADELYSKINLLSAIKLFDKLHEYESRREEYSNLLQSITQKITETKNNKTPNRAMLSSFERASSELKLSSEAHEAALSSFEDKLRSANAQRIPKELDDALTSAGGAENMRHRFEKLTAAKKRALTLFITFAVISLFAIAAGGVCVALMAKKVLAASLALTLSAVLFGLGALGVILVVLFINIRKKRRAEISELCSSISSSSDQTDFIAALQKAELEKTASEQRERELSFIKNELDIKKRMLDESLHKANALISVLGIENAADANGALHSMQLAISEISLFCDRSDELKNRISLLDDRIKTLSAELSGYNYNEHQIRRKVSSDILAMSDSDIQNAKKEKSYYDLQLKALSEKKLSTERALLERKYVTESPFELSAKLDSISEELEEQKKNYAAVSAAIDAITKASASMRNSLSPKIRAISGEYLSQITDGKYNSVTLSDSLELSMSEDGFTYPAEAFSTGTKDMAYLAMRLSILKLLPCEEAPPMLMDESFAMIDDGRAKKLLSLLSEHCAEGVQCIIFTCHSREERLLSESGIAFSRAEM